MRAVLRIKKKPYTTDAVHVWQYNWTYVPGAILPLVHTIFMLIYFCLLNFMVHIIRENVYHLQFYIFLCYDRNVYSSFLSPRETFVCILCCFFLFLLAARISLLLFLPFFVNHEEYDDVTFSWRKIVFGPSVVW